MTGALLLAVGMMALASFGATLLLTALPPTSGADFRTALLRLAQALPLAVGLLYGIGSWWAGPLSLLLGIGAGLAAARFTGGATVPVGVVTMIAGLSYLASIVLRLGPPT